MKGEIDSGQTTLLKAALPGSILERVDGLQYQTRQRRLSDVV
jgi:hypothetical protein